MKLSERIKGIEEKTERKQRVKKERKQKIVAYRERQKELEYKFQSKLYELEPGSKEAAELIRQCEALANIHGGAIAYDQKHNFPKLASPFIGKPGRVPRVKTGK
jgi:molybdopterin-biosynthesis enzyme MoeA-like protein